MLRFSLVLVASLLLGVASANADAGDACNAATDGFDGISTVGPLKVYKCVKVCDAAASCNSLNLAQEGVPHLLILELHLATTCDAGYSVLLEWSETSAGTVSHDLSSSAIQLDANITQVRVDMSRGWGATFIVPTVTHTNCANLEVLAKFLSVPPEN